MVGIVTGNGLGLTGSSRDVLGPNGQVGVSGLGQAGSQVYVNAKTGNLVIQQTDELLAGLGPDIGVVRTYNSGATFDFDNNDSWQISLYRKLSSFVAGVSIKRTAGDGTEHTYTYDGVGKYVSTAGSGADDVLVKNADGSWTWTDGDSRMTETYQANPLVTGEWRITGNADRDLNTLAYAYAANGLIYRVTTANGEITELSYNAQKRLQQINIITSITTTRISYDHDTSGRLNRVKIDLTPAISGDNKYYVTNYTYHGATNRIATIETDGAGLVGIQYYDNGRVKQITDAAGLATQFAYFENDINNNDDNSTQIIDALGRTTTLTHDGLGNLTRLQGPAGSAQDIRYTYNGRGDLLDVTDNRNNKTVYGYDTRGNLARQQDAAGNVVEYSYNSANQRLTQTTYRLPDPDGAGALQAASAEITHYVYDIENHLRFVVSPQGRVTEYRYTAAGQEKTSLVYNDGTYGGAPADITVWDEADLEVWTTTQDLRKLQRVDTYYDARGLINLVMKSSNTDTAGNSVADSTRSFTDYVYDSAGRLLKTFDTRGHATTTENDYATTYVYDGLGRQISITRHDAAGAPMPTVLAGGLSVETIYNELTTGLTVRTRLANGLVKVSTYDVRGLLVGQTEQTTTGQVLSTITHQYDALGRLRITTDPLGQKTYYVYDDAGNLTATIDADGSFVENRYNNNGQVIRTIRYAARGNMTTIAGLFAPVSGMVPNVKIGDAGVRPPGTAGVDRHTYFLYDAAGRLAKIIDAAWTVTEYRYDGESQLIETIRYANPLSTTQLNVVKGFTGEVPPTDSNTKPAPSAADRRTRSFYSIDGLLRGVLDAEGYLIENLYDAARQRIKTTRYATPTPTSNAAKPDLRADGTLDELRPEPATLSAKTQVDRYFYNGQGWLLAHLDAEGYLTEHIYNSVGLRTQTRRFFYVTATSSTSHPDLRATGSLDELRPALHAENQRLYFQYDALNRITEIADHPSDKITRYIYDNAGNILTTTTAANSVAESRVVTRRYDLQGRLTHELSGEGSEALRVLMLGAPSQPDIDTLWNRYGTRHSYDVTGRRISTTTPDGTETGRRTVYYYDTDGRMTHRINGLGEVTEYSYDVFGGITKETYYSTRISAGALTGGQTASLLALGILVSNSGFDRVIQTSYNVRGGIATTTDAHSVVSWRYYNAFGELDYRVDTNGATNKLTNYYYDRRGQITATIEELARAAERSSSVIYDAFGRAVQSADGLNHTRTTSYDRLGRVVETKDANYAVRRMSYDAFDRVLTQTDALNNTTSLSYNSVNRSVTMTTADGVSTTTTRNRHGETVAILDGYNITTTYSYNKDGQLTQTVKDSGGLNVTSKNRYDMAGQLFETENALGTVTRYQYDAVGRVLTRIVDPTGLNLTTTYLYDALGQTAWVRDALGIWTQTTFDKKGQAKEVAVDPASVPNPANLTGPLIANAGLNLRTSYTYDDQGRTLTVITGFGTSEARTTQYVYDKFGRRTQEIDDAGGLNLTVLYTYDKADNVVSRTDPDGNVTWYTHDNENRLQYTVDATGAVTRSFYDAKGQVTLNKVYAIHLTANELSELAALRALNGRVSATDVADRLNYDSEADRETFYTYDVAGRVVFTVDATGAATRNFYDSLGQLTLYKIYATRLTTSEMSELATLRTEYGRVTSTNVADRLNYDSEADRETFYSYDAAGRAVFTVDATGAVTRNFYDTAGQVTLHKVYAIRLTASELSELVTMRAANGRLTLGDIGDRLNYDADADRETFYTHDAAGRLVFIVDTTGTVTRNFYDAAGQVTLHKVYATRLTASELSELVALRAANGRLTSTDIGARLNYDADADRESFYTHDAAGRLVFTVDATGAVTRNFYDSLGQVTLRTTYATNLTTGELSQLVTLRETNGRLTSTDISDRLNYDSDADRSTFYTNDAVGRLVFTVDATGAVTRNFYDSLGRVTLHKVYAIRLTVTELGELAALRAEHGRVTSTNVGERLNYDSVSDRETFYTYDIDGRLAFTVDATGAVTRNFYDSLGQLTLHKAYAIRLTASELSELTGLRETNGQVTSTNVSDRLNYDGDTDHGTFYTYDLDGRLAYTVDATGAVTRNFYDSLGQVTLRKIYATRLTASELNELVALRAENGRVASTNVSDRLNYDDADRATFYTYDLDGRLAFTVDASGAVTRNFYDSLGQVTLHKAYAIRLTASEMSELANLRTENGRVTSTNVSDRLNYDSDSDRATFYTYDIDGRLAYTVDATGAVSRNFYDSLGQVTLHKAYAIRLTAAELSELVALRTEHGRVTSTNVSDRLNYDSDSDRATFYTYDIDGRLAYTVDATGAVSRNFYDSLGQVTLHKAYAIRLTAAELSELVALRTEHGRVTSANVSDRLNYDSDSDRATFYTHDAAGRLAFTVNATGAVTRNFYDSMDLVATHKAYAIRLTASELSELTALRTEHGRVTSTNISDRLNFDAADRETNFKYDVLGRQTELKDALDYTETTVYDAFGNKTQFTNKVNGKFIYTYDKLGRVLTETLPVKAEDIGGTYVNVVNRNEYDAFGNRTKRIEAEGLPIDANGNVMGRTTTWTYDKRGRIKTQAGEKLNVYSPANIGSPVEMTPTEHRTYDSFGNVIEVIGPNGGRTLTYYDGMNRTTGTISPIGALSTHAYNAMGNVTQERHYTNAIALPATAGGAVPVPNGKSYRETNYIVDGAGRTIETQLTGKLLVNTGDSELTVQSVLVGEVEETGGDINYVPTVQTALTTTREYDAHGNVVKEIDARGLSTWRYYDAMGNKVLEVDTGRYATAWEYDANGSIRKETRYATQYGGPLRTDIRPTVTANTGEDRVTSFTYDKLGRVLTENIWNVLRDTGSAHTIFKNTATATAITRYEYNGLGKITKKTDAMNNVSNWKYDLMGRQTQSQGAQYRENGTGDYIRPTTDTIYNGLGLVARNIERGRISSEDRRTIYTYGVNGNLLSRNVVGLITNFKNDATGRAVSESFTRAGATDSKLFFYDLAGRQVKQIVKQSSTVLQTQETQYNMHGDVTKKRTYGIASTAGAWQETADYDTVGRVWRTNGQDGVYKLYIHDANGNTTAMIKSSELDLKNDSIANYARMMTPAFLSSTNADKFLFEMYQFNARNLLTGTIQGTRPGTQLGAFLTNPVDGSVDVEQPLAERYASTPKTSLITGGGITEKFSARLSLRTEVTNETHGGNNNYEWGDCSDALQINVDTSAWGDGDVEVTLKLNSKYGENGGHGDGLEEITFNGVERTWVLSTEDAKNKSLTFSETVSIEGGALKDFYTDDFTGLRRANRSFTITITKKLAGTGDVLVWRRSDHAVYTRDSGMLTTHSVTLTEEPKHIIIRDLPPGTTDVVLRYRKTTSAGGWAVRSMAKMQNAAGVDMAGWFRLDWSALAEGSYDYYYEAVSSVGEVLNAGTGVMGIGATPTMTFETVAIGSVGAGRVFMGGDGLLYFSQINREHGSAALWSDIVDKLHLRYREVGQDQWSAPVNLPAQTSLGKGWFAFDPVAQGFNVGHTYEYLIEAKDLHPTTGDVITINRGYGRFKVGASYADDVLALRQTQTFKLSGYQPGSVMELNYTRDNVTRTVVRSANSDGNVFWDPSELDQGNYTFSYYVYANEADRAAHRSPLIANARGNFRVGHEDDSDSFTITHRGTGAPDADPRKAPWAIADLERDAIIIRRQGNNAFGETISETDGRGNVTRYDYNSMGLLIKQSDPTVKVTAQNGVETDHAPITQYSYDLIGRLIATKDANGNISVQHWLAADTGRLTSQTNALGEEQTSGYDIFGDRRITKDARLRATYYTYNLRGLLTEVDRPIAIEKFGYDEAGNRTSHTNADNKIESTAYDALGRVISTTSYGDQTTTYAYTYDGGIGGVGGFKKLTTLAAQNTEWDRTSDEHKDVFGRVAWRRDYGNRVYTYTYDLAGRLTNQKSTLAGSSLQNIRYGYFANGYLKYIDDVAMGTYTSYLYDADGNRTQEYYRHSSDNRATWTYDQISNVSYDAMNRVTRILDPRANISYEYDAVGNRRRVYSIYHDGLDGKTTKQDYWYTYDNLNRFVITMGQLEGGVIKMANNSVKIAYDEVGQRKSATYGKSYDPDPVAANRRFFTEEYTYNSDGYLLRTAIDMDTTDNGGVFNGETRSQRWVDLLGRTVWQLEVLESGAPKSISYMTYNADSQLLERKEWDGKRKGDIDANENNIPDTGAPPHTRITTNTIRADSILSGSTSVDGGTTVVTEYDYQWWDEAKQLNIRSAPSNPDADDWASGYSRLIYDKNGHLAEVHDAADRQSGMGRSMRYITNAEGLIMERRELMGGTANAGGFVLSAPKSATHRFYYHDGHRIADVGDDGTLLEAGTQSYAEQLVQGKSQKTRDRYRNWKPIASADFDQNYQPINRNYPGASPTSYTVRAGDTLAGIAAAVWGDASLWYLIADANGLAAGSQLKADQLLVIPNKVTNIHNNAQTFKPYNPSDAIGDVNPTLPEPPPPPSGGGCGGIGTILMMAMMMVAAVFTAGIALAPMGATFSTIMATGAAAMTGGAVVGASVSAAIASTSAVSMIGAAMLGGAVGSVVSQGVGVAIGAQDKFSWKAVGTSAVSAGIGAGAGAALVGAGIIAPAMAATASIPRLMLNAAATSITAQGISMAAGLQKKFSWAGVASSAAGAAAGKWMDGTGPFGSFASRFAGGATGSLLSGQDSSWGNVAADALGGTIAGSMMGRTVNMANSDTYAPVSDAEIRELDPEERVLNTARDILIQRIHQGKPGLDVHRFYDWALDNSLGLAGSGDDLAAGDGGKVVTPGVKNGIPTGIINSTRLGQVVIKDIFSENDVNPSRNAPATSDSPSISLDGTAVSMMPIQKNPYGIYNRTNRRYDPVAGKIWEENFNKGFRGEAYSGPGGGWGELFSMTPVGAAGNFIADVREGKGWTAVKDGAVGVVGGKVIGAVGRRLDKVWSGPVSTGGPASGFHREYWASISGEVNTPSTIRALRQNGSPEALATAKLVKRGDVEVVFKDTDPWRQGATGRKPWGENTVEIYRDQVTDPTQAAGVVAHETKHVLQNTTPSTHLKDHEVEAYMWQRAVDPDFKNSTTVESIVKFVDTDPLYAPYGWAPDSLWKP